MGNLELTSSPTSILGEQDHEVLRYQAFCADQLVDRLRLCPGEKVLDVASGAGAVATAAAQRVAPSGRVFAVDDSETALDRLEAKARHLGIGNIDLQPMGPQSLDFRSGYFDAVVCAYGIILADDMAAALGEWSRVLKPGGRLCVATYAASAFQPMLDSLLELFGLRGDDPGDPVLRRWVEVGAPGALERMLAHAGLTDVDVTEQSIGYHLSDPRDWGEIVRRTPLSRLLRCAQAAERDAMLQRHLAEVGALAGADGLWLDVRTVFAIGRRPPG
jgi:SAM-dependent methyltransferase